MLKFFFSWWYVLVPTPHDINIKLHQPFRGRTNLGHHFLHLPNLWILKMITPDLIEDPYPLSNSIFSWMCSVYYESCMISESSPNVPSAICFIFQTDGKFQLHASTMHWIIKIVNLGRVLWCTHVMCKRDLLIH